MKQEYNLRSFGRNIKENGLVSALGEDWRKSIDKEKKRIGKFAYESSQALAMALLLPVAIYDVARNNYRS